MDMSDKHSMSDALPSHDDSHLRSLLKIEEGLPLPVQNGEHGIDYYLYERYAADSQSWKRKAYYFLKPVIPRPVQIALRKKYVNVQAKGSFPAWPIEPVVVDAAKNFMLNVLSQADVPAIHRIAPWPDETTFAFAITHDVEWDTGLQHAQALADIERDLGFTSSWNIVPERYPIDWSIIETLQSRGFEIGIHGLKHDGKLFQSRRVFEQRAAKIHQYAGDWKAVGFRSPSTLRNVDWMPELGFEYDSSFPDTDPYEPQPGGCCSIWPFFIRDLVELPLTMPQDHTLFEILGLRDISVWKQKADWIEKMGGLVLINVHPDYMMSTERLRFYEGFLKHMKGKAAMWHALPKSIAQWWRNRDASTLKREGGAYSIDGPDSSRSSILRTSMKGGFLVDQVIRQGTPA